MIRLDRRGAAALIGCAVILSFSGCGPSLKEPPPYPSLTQADLDHDKKVTKSEWTTAGLTKFDALDTDHDGALTGAEIETTRQTLDKDQDGTVSTGEVSPVVAALDADKDGTISQGEFQTGVIKNLGGDDGATSVQRDQVVQQLDRQFSTGTQGIEEPVDYGDPVQHATVLHFLLFEFE